MFPVLVRCFQNNYCFFASTAFPCALQYFCRVFSYIIECHFHAFSSPKLLANLLNLYVSTQKHNRFIGDEDGMLHDGGVATFDKVLLRVRATIFYEERVIDEGTCNGRRFEHRETDRANAATDYW